MISIIVKDDFNQLYVGIQLSIYIVIIYRLGLIYDFLGDCPGNNFVSVSLSILFKHHVQYQSPKRKQSILLKTPFGL